MKKPVQKFCVKRLTWVFGLFLTTPLFADITPVTEQCRKASLDQSGFLECLQIQQQESESGLAAVELSWIEALQSAVVTESVAETQSAAVETDTATNSARDLALINRSFKDFRDQHCAFIAAQSDRLSAPTRLLSCKTDLNRKRSAELQSMLYEQRTQLREGLSYRGFYLSTDDGGLFQSCELRQDWVISASEEITDQLGERYQQVTGDDLEMVYVELRGQLSKSTNGGVNELRINKLNLLRPILDRDCRFYSPAEPVPGEDKQQTSNDSANDVADDLQSESSVVPEQTASASGDSGTIDDYGQAGFLYGYFGSWTSQCAIEAQQVCSALAQHSYATQGDWQLMIDRSADLVWRIRLMPTTDSHLVTSQLQISIDGVAKAAISVNRSQLSIGQTYTLANGANALQLLNSMRNGASVEVRWNSTEQSSASVAFSLAGVSRALQYFDNRELR